MVFPVSTFVSFLLKPLPRWRFHSGATTNGRLSILQGMADPNLISSGHDNPYYIPFTDEFMNIADNLNLSLPEDLPLIPQSSGKGKEAMEIGSSETLEFWDFYKESNNVRYSPVQPSGINGETSNKKETNLGNESLNNNENLALQAPFSFPSPIPQSGEKNKATNFSIESLLENPVPEFTWGISNQRETKLGNEIVENPNHPTPEDVSGQEPFSFPSLVPRRYSEDIYEAIGPLRKTINSGDLRNESKSNEFNSQVSCSTYAETSNQGKTINLGKQSLDYMDSRQLSVWPSVKVPIGCTCCEILREIVHVKGRLVMKLQIHGKLVGIFFHAILDVQLDGKPVSNEMIDFYEKSFEEVKKFLTQYCIKRNQEGFTMTKDPRSSFFQVLCTGFGWDENLFDDNYTDKTLSPDSGDIQMDEANQQVVANASDEAANSNNKDRSSINLTEQRKRVKEMSFKDLANYFHLPRKEAALRLGLSETVVHNIWCKSVGGKRRWPYRKVHSLEKEISELRALLNSDIDPRERDHARNEIQMKEEEMAELYSESA